MEEPQILTQVPLIFKWQQEVLKFNICVNCSFPKTDLETNSLNMEIKVLRMSVFLNSNFQVGV